VWEKGHLLHCTLSNLLDYGVSLCCLETLQLLVSSWLHTLSSSEQEELESAGSVVEILWNHPIVIYTISRNLSIKIWRQKKKKNHLWK